MGIKYSKIFACIFACIIFVLLFIQWGAVDGKAELLVEQTTVYLPIISKPLAAPSLNTIDNADMDNLYTVSWSAVPGADLYVLEESAGGAFSSPVKVYEGPAVNWTTPEGKLPGTYYYRVQAVSAIGPSGWSNVQAVTIYPLYVGMYAGWYSDGYVRGSENADMGLYELVLIDQLVDADTVDAYWSWEYDPDPYNFGYGYFYEQYSPTTGVLKSTVYNDPNWLWDHDWKLGYNDQFTSGQIVYIDGQRFQVTGPWNGTTVFGATVTYWQFVNLDRFQFWVDGDWSQYVDPANVTLRYDAGPSRLLLYSNIFRKYYYRGSYTGDTVQYITDLDLSSSFKNSPDAVIAPQGKRTQSVEQTSVEDPRGYRKHK